MLDDRGLCVQEGQGTGAPGVLQGTFRAVPGDGRAVQPGVLAAGPAGAHASPLPFQLTLHFAVEKAVQDGHHQALKRSDAQFKQDLVFGGDADRKHSKYHVVNSEQWDKQQRGLG